MYLVSQRVVTPEGLRPLAIGIREGRIDALIAPEDVPAGAKVVDAGSDVILPGLVDPHVHINEPGRTEWEGFVTATAAAAAGGLTTLCDMPLNSSPVTITERALEAKLEAAQGKLAVDVGFHAGLVPGHVADVAMLLDRGVLGVKAFLVHSGIDDFPAAGEPELRAIMPLLAERGIPLLVHAECDTEGAPKPNDRTSYRAYLASRPGSWEDKAIERMIRLCRETGCPVHIVHLATASALPMIRAARAEGLPLTVETCPHYLTFCAEEIPDGAPVFKCAPPIREASHREALWQALIGGDIDLVATDHSPCPPEMKHLEDGDLFSAWGGICGLQLSLPAVWTGLRARGGGMGELARWMAEAPAKLLGVADRKGRIAPGVDADLVIFDPDASFRVDPEFLLHRHKPTPYAGRELYGRVKTTYLRGMVIHDVDGPSKSLRAGQAVFRGAARGAKDHRRPPS
ncbi:MAG TPA: allantoinase AllB [Kiritimatiellia bacterium]|mgnify:CR=1 FL=1|nr:allantoinase AllB [Kiritimatiellia bacterium]